jgi:hypothetical protein
MCAITYSLNNRPAIPTSAEPLLPLSVSTHAANHHEARLVQLCFDFYMIEAKPENFDRRSRLRQRSAG